MSDANDGYTVIQTRLETIDRNTLRQVLRQHGGMNAVDAGQIANREQGLLGGRFSQQQAETVAATLTNLGHPARPIANQRLIKLGNPRPVRWLEIHPDRLGVPWDLHGATRDIDWSCVFVVSTGQLAKVVERRESFYKPVSSYGERHRLGISEVETYQRSEFNHVCDVIGMADDDQFVHVRLPAPELAFDRILGPNTAGKKSFDRYLEVVETLCRHSTSALVNPATRKLLIEREENFRTAEGGYHELREDRAFSRYNRWLLQLVIFKEQERAAES